MGLVKIHIKKKGFYYEKVFISTDCGFDDFHGICYDNVYGIGSN